MSPRFLLAILLSAALALAGGAVAAPRGAGFIEQLMSGQDDPAPSAWRTPGRGRASAEPAVPQPGAGGTGDDQSIEHAFDPRYQRQEVAYETAEPPGTIVIDTPARFLYLVQPGGRALRYGIGVGRPGFTWSGVHAVTRKAEWPDWRPPPEMLLRKPDLPRFVPGGEQNPLGARALYLGSSLYRIHGTNEPETIGHSVSSGCIRLRNEDVTDLYGRVAVGTRVVVM